MTTAAAAPIYITPDKTPDLADCFFYHTMELPGHGVIDGHWDLRGKFGEYTNFHDFSGERVLDIGAGSGFLSFAAEEAGAREVVSFDMDHSLRQDFLPDIMSPCNVSVRLTAQRPPSIV